MARDYSEDIEINYVEEALERNAKQESSPIITTAQLRFKFKLKRETTI